MIPSTLKISVMQWLIHFTSIVDSTGQGYEMEIKFKIVAYHYYNLELEHVCTLGVIIDVDVESEIYFVVTFFLVEHAATILPRLLSCLHIDTDLLVIKIYV